jgi:hypothetical protein
MRRTCTAILALAFAACATDPVAPDAARLAGGIEAHGITNGNLDGSDHPHVGLMIAQDANGTPLWRCSGTLISPTLYLTAGHCTEAPAAHVEIWFDADVGAGRPANGYPFTGDVGGTPHTHPQYIPTYFSRYDIGVVVLDAPVAMASYATLPAVDELEQLATRRGLQNVTFTAVGYGLQRINPVFQERALVRMNATPHLLQINTALVGTWSLLLSNNHSTGGTCFGDSGGPNFIGNSNVVGGVTSFGINGNCAGTGGVYRVDRAVNLDWLATF